MKTKIALKLAAALLLLSTINQQLSTAFAQGTAFTYQGRLNDGTNPATGSYDLRFAIYDAAGAGAQQGNLLTNSPTGVTNGLFAVTLDFGNQFPGADRWLEIAARTNDGGAFTTLSPRQKLTATPYAITAGNVTGVLPAAGLSGTYSSAVTLNNAGNQFSGAFSGNGASVSNVNAVTLGGLGAANFWKTGGNAGTTAGANFVGTTDNQPLEFKVNGQRALRLEPNASAPNVIGGSPMNIVSGAAGAVIAGGGVNLIYLGGDFSAISGGQSNVVDDAINCVIAGGKGNTIYVSDTATIAGGYQNYIDVADFSAIGGGYQNLISPSSTATIAGGYQNYIDAADFSAIGGGDENQIQANAYYSTIGGGGNNQIQPNASYSTIGGGGSNFIKTNAYYSTIGGGVENFIQPNAYESTIGGGYGNQIWANATISTIGGGSDNLIQTSADHSTIGGGNYNTIQTDAISSTIGGGYNNQINASASTIGGGNGNFIAGERGTIAGGSGNEIDTAIQSTIGGGEGNYIGTNSSASTIAGGIFCSIGAFSARATIGGGDSQIIGDFSSYSTIGGGYANTVEDHSTFATIPGGYFNVATNRAFAAGTQAQAIHTGAFVWGDSTPAYISSTTNDSVTFRASGGYRLFSDTNATAGVSLAPGGTAWAVISDRNAKKDFAPLDSRGILEKLAALPITQWHYKWEQQNVTPHIGPMAQDFKAAFYPGTDDKSITTQEADGVAFAAIQGLNQKLTTELEQKQTEITELQQRLEALEKIIRNPNSK